MLSRETEKTDHNQRLIFWVQMTSKDSASGNVETVLMIVNDVWLKFDFIRQHTSVVDHIVIDMSDQCSVLDRFGLDTMDLAMQFLCTHVVGHVH